MKISFFRIVVEVRIFRHLHPLVTLIIPDYSAYAMGRRAPPRKPAGEDSRIVDNTTQSSLQEPGALVTSDCPHYTARARIARTHRVRKHRERRSNPLPPALRPAYPSAASVFTASGRAWKADDNTESKTKYIEMKKEFFCLHPVIRRCSNAHAQASRHRSGPHSDTDSNR